jgi:HK97 gp10 family phage protein
MAASKANFEIIGLKELIKAFEEFGDIAIPEVRKKVDEAGELLLAKAREKVHVRYGKLKSSLHLKKPTSSKYVIENILTWGDDVRDYGAPLELGHNVKFGKNAPVVGYSRPRPFLRPAADESKRQVFKIITEGFDNAFKKFGGIKI